jgi:prepilin-type N-terminal cleavage/methylation domain-containing protein
MRAVRKAFTLIELLAVLVIFGVLSAIAIAKFVSTKEAAYLASMKADLRNFAVYEQNYSMDNQGNYFVGNGSPQGFVASPGVTVSATAVPGIPPSWRATATHDKTNKTCSIGASSPDSWDIVCP